LINIFKIFQLSS